MAEWVKARENKWLVYSQDASLRVDPDRTGATDCSGMCRAAYLAVTGMDIGWYTGDQSLGGKEIASGSRGQGVSAFQLEPGDLVFCNFNGYNPTMGSRRDVRGRRAADGHGPRARPPLLGGCIELCGEHLQLAG